MNGNAPTPEAWREEVDRRLAAYRSLAGEQDAAEQTAGGAETAGEDS
jgi:hypothetical protein